VIELTVAIVGLVVSVLAAYFGYVQVREKFGRRRRSVPGAGGPAGLAGPALAAPALAGRGLAGAGSGPQGSGYDAFVSYAQADGDRAERLAGALVRAGLRVFLARWIEVGLVEYLEKERGMLGSANGILLFSQASMRQPAIRDDYAALLMRAHSGGRRFIPVLIEDVSLPPFAAIRKPLDLRDVGDRDYEARIAVLVRAIQAPGAGTGG
jgi:hypothetical protein